MKTRHYLLCALMSMTCLAMNAAVDGCYGKAELSESTDGGVVTEIAFFTPEIVNVRHFKSESTVTKRNLVVTLDKQDVAVNVSDDGDDAVVLTSSAMSVRYEKSTGCVAFFDLGGNQLLTEKSGQTVLTARKDGNDDSYKVKQTFKLQSGERIYGLGQLQNGNWNQRNRSYDYMIEGNTSVWIPYIHSTKGYALYWDNPSPTSYKDTSSGMSFESAVGYGVDYFFLLGSTIDGQVATQRMRQLTGQMPMIPLWAYGFFQSKERYESADETMSVVRRYRELGVPIDCVVQDWQYWGTNKYWNAMEFRNAKFSNYQEMIDYVHEQDAHLLISVWANFGPNTKPYAYFKEHNQLMKQGDNIMTDTYPSNEGVAIYDTYSEDARNQYWKFLYDGIASKGADAYWMDSSEPDHYQGGAKMEETFDFVTGMGCTWRSVRNAFPLVHVGGVYDHHRAEPSLAEKRCMILTRSGYAGLQRYGANTWSGDITASWTTLANQIPAALSYSICGNPNWNSDTGAFFNGDLQGPGNDEYNELYARWLQFSTFCPMMRSHGADTDKAIYVWGKRGNKYFDNEEKYIHLRYSLLPYIYSTAWDVHTNGHSFMNPMAVMFPQDDKTFLLKDQFMFGQSIIVAPMLKYQAASRSVYLPDAAKWIDFWTGEEPTPAPSQGRGNGDVTKDVDLQTLPLYVRGGSILPIALPAQSAKVSDWDTLQIRIYPGSDTEFTLYEDEGDSYRYESGSYSTIKFSWDDAAGKLTVGSRNGSFKGMLEKRVFDIVLVGKNHGTGESVSPEANVRVEYDGTATSVNVDANKTFEVEYAEKTGGDSQMAADKELPLDEFNARINGSGSYTDGIFKPSVKGFGGWWNDGGLMVADHRYVVAELEEPVEETVALRVYGKDNYSSAPLSAKFSASATKLAVETGNSSYVYGIGLWSDQRRDIKPRRVWLTNELPSDVSKDASVPYTFNPEDWQTGDPGRVNQSKISYDNASRTITINATGAQNTCLQLAASKSDTYVIPRDKKYFAVKVSNVSDKAADSQVWFMLGQHVGSVNPSKVFMAPDGDAILAWDISAWMPDTDNVHLCFGNQFLICFGMTSTTGVSTVSEIGFYAEEELPNVGTGIQSITIPSSAEDDGIYDLSGRRLTTPSKKEIVVGKNRKYINN